MVKTAFVTLTLVTLTSAVVSQPCLAKLTVDNTQPIAVPVVQAPEEITTKDVEKIIPTDLQATNDLNQVALRIADRSIQAWFNSAHIQASAIGQTANTVQEKMATDITVKSDEPEGVEHKFSVQLMALQAMAKLQYSGWLNAVFNYDARAAKSMIEFSEKVFNKDFFVNHSSSSKGDVSAVGIKWGW